MTNILYSTLHGQTYFIAHYMDKVYGFTLVVVFTVSCITGHTVYSLVELELLYNTPLTKYMVTGQFPVIGLWGKLRQGSLSKLLKVFIKEYIPKN